MAELVCKSVEIKISELNFNKWGSNLQILFTVKMQFHCIASATCFMCFFICRPHTITECLESEIQSHLKMQE